ncbi:MAG: ribose 5-phosphate isomerase B [Pseudomonadota bacterium]|nr:ribose 5-phosphate isomerase B [Pseudomonadota bacterium]MEC8461995.1 ribose 5-phosphate isomerase B [Pseudomonadota bacterium]MEC8726143.1 ribose 5-phosphate isomerase B [Pseudomonadota bacterium]
MPKEIVGLAVDHGGVVLKQTIKSRIQFAGLAVLDLGTDGEVPVDYPDYADILIAAMSVGDVTRGVLVCGTGIGISIAANRHKGIRAALCYDEETAILSRQHNDANVLCMGGRKTDKHLAGRLVDLFLTTEFEGGRHIRRVGKLG